jgi:hypothetical protein
MGLRAAGNLERFRINFFVTSRKNDALSCPCRGTLPCRALNLGPKSGDAVFALNGRFWSARPHPALRAPSPGGRGVGDEGALLLRTRRRGAKGANVGWAKRSAWPTLRSPRFASLRPE